MLVLTRKINESIIIADNIEIRILEVKGEKVKIGVIAPKELTVLREELYREVSEQNKQAAAVDENGLKQLSQNL
ncbi:MAG: carbon storage regulator CsrA [Actinomycetota bacterium]|jgi:carbon storage regulator|nr:carbon storage regulator CsrA [Actinomycetota bacterium]